MIALLIVVGITMVLKPTIVKESSSKAKEAGSGDKVFMLKL